MLISENKQGFIFCANYVSSLYVNQECTSQKKIQAAKIIIKGNTNICDC